MTTKQDQKLDETDLAIQAITTANPNASMQDISNSLHEIKKIDRTNVYRRLTRSQQLRENIDIVRQNSSEYLSRTLVPLALKQTHSALKAKGRTHDETYKDRKLILDKEYGTDDSKRPTQPVQVNIGQIQALIAESIDVHNS